MQKSLRVFLDTSAILAGLNSPTGAAGVVLALCVTEEIAPMISRQIIEEAERNIAQKFPGLMPGWQSFLLIPPEIIDNPNHQELKHARSVLPTSDAPILASALRVHPDYMITWNTKDFLKPQVLSAVSFPILTPGDFLVQYRRQFDTKSI
ncbi:hypothetical protein A3A39_01685 [Candidatus Kaiserbacteria bacterium RIFCSPLOWO2_01_FULL_54_13]|uniref:PIN domain-containing protein n=1 Tax=Candidatus Kaiserbacteria bacterium RIFCSPLOWO2_01_FULL_54_13 TaxID=1798512 RepID=A0A1F6F1C1_9BACT|nr:MAG: hypothetical protein A3A39_01685 [Candidatus Kaiserbacteria bacterium RIFCSPLOWO2_01_FULL_54_13]